MSSIEVNGKRYKVVEKLPFHGVGKQARMVLDDDEERVAVKDGGVWRFWTVKDRLGGLR